MKRKIIIATLTVIITYVLVLVISNFLQRGPSKDILKRMATKSHIITINTALDMFKADSGEYPESGYGLSYLVQDCGMTNWNGPYLRAKEVPKDYWGNEFRYDRINGIPIVVSAGKDGMFESKDDVETTQRMNIQE